MKLLASLASPYTRKVRIVLAEKKIDCEMELVDVARSTTRSTGTTRSARSHLLLDDGTALYDSRVIVELSTASRPSA